MARRFTTRKSFSEIGQLGLSELRKEYTIMRDIFEKRRKRAERAGIQRAEIYGAGGYARVKKLSEIQASQTAQGFTAEEVRADLIYRVRELANLVGTREGGLPAAGVFSISGIARQRKNVNDKIVKSLHDAGYEHISKSTLKNFGRFMDEMRRQYGKKLPNSEEMAEFFDRLKYDTKRKSTQFIVDLWEEFKANGYQPNDGSVDLFAR